MVRDISPEEVKLHNTEKDCWIIVHGKVYDVTKYLNDHPGGVEIVTDLAGQDASVDYDDVGHTQEANEILEKFVIGVVKSGAPVAAASQPAVSAPAPAPVAAAPAPAPVAAPVKPAVSKPAYNVQPPKQPEEDNTMMVIGGVVVAAIAAGFFLLKRKA